jgi:D-tyrosyl-tRNA(Tyr) deacylase
MIALIQRVTHANISVDQKEIASIKYGILALIGIEKLDNEQSQQKLAKKLMGYRIFPDEKGHMNLNLEQVKGELLLVPQFTLAADTNSGLRPSFSKACPPEIATHKFTQFVKTISELYPQTQQGVFGADMSVSLTNDGPVTFWLQV